MTPAPVAAAINLPWAVDRLEADALGFIGATLNQHDCPRPEDVVAVARDADAILSALAPLPEAALVALERCRVIAEHGVGVDHIDLDAATRRGIQVCNIPTTAPGRSPTMPWRSASR